MAQLRFADGWCLHSLKMRHAIPVMLIDGTGSMKPNDRKGTSHSGPDAGSARASVELLLSAGVSQSP